MFYPLGFEFSGSDDARKIIQSIGVLTKAINTTGVKGGGGGLDVQPWINNGVPGGSIWTQNDRYFNYHHTNADNMAVLNPDELDRAAAVWTVYAYVSAAAQNSPHVSTLSTAVGTPVVWLTRC